MKKLLFILVLFSVLSCGSRKKDSSNKEESSKTDFSGIFRNSGNSQEFLNLDFNFKKSSLTTADQQSESEKEEFSIKPIDPSKPATYTGPNGKKHVLENAEMTNKKVRDISKTKSEKSENSQEFLKAELQKKAEQKAELKAKIIAEAKKREADLHLERKSSGLWNLLWILIPIALFFIIKFWWKKFKSNNPIA